MNDIPTLELDEIIAKYERHPEIFDIYVEGEFDKDFINEFLQAHALATEISVYAIDEIQPVNDEIDRLNLNKNSNKSKVIALASILENQLHTTPDNVICLVDADTDQFLEKLRQEKALKYTDFSCMEMYALNNHTIKKFIEYMCHLKPEKTLEFWNLAKKILPIQFAVRALNEKESLWKRTPHFTSGLKDKKNYDSFEIEKFFQAFIQTGELQKREANLKIEFLEIVKKLPNDLREKSHGHDFIDFLFSFAWHNDGLKLRDKDTEVLKFGGRIVTLAVDKQDLKKEGFFSMIFAMHANFLSSTKKFGV